MVEPAKNPTLSPQQQECTNLLSRVNKNFQAAEAAIEQVLTQPDFNRRLTPNGFVIVMEREKGNPVEASRLESEAAKLDQEATGMTGKEAAGKKDEARQTREAARYAKNPPAFGTVSLSRAMKQRLTNMARVCGQAGMSEQAKKWIDKDPEMPGAGIPQIVTSLRDTFAGEIFRDKKIN